jgi:single-strand DNA-binding protein
MADLKMPEINSVVLAGNLTRDPVYRTTTNGNLLVNFTVASNRRYRDTNNQWQEDVCFVGVIARNKLADSCNQRLKKGSAVLVEGELQSRNWKYDDGNSHRVVEIKARRIQFLNKILGQIPSQETEPVSTGENSGSTSGDGEGPKSFEDDSYVTFISSEESELIKRNSPDG